MNIERKLIISILKLTKDGPVSREVVKKDASIASEIVENLLKKLQNEGLIYVQKNILGADGTQRLKMAVRVISLGADIENISGFLQWKEFEDMVATALERNGFVVKKNLRFKYAGRKWEIDILGCKKPIALCVDCKHWHRGLSQFVLKKIVEEQAGRTFALAKSLPNQTIKIDFASWRIVKFVPAVMSLIAGKFKFYDGVPIVPVLQLQDFLSQLPAYADSLKHFSKQLTNQLYKCS